MDKLLATEPLKRLIRAPIGLFEPDFRLEMRLANHDYKFVAGVDEAGRGPLAGPVVAAAVILDGQKIPSGLDDSKRLSERSRNELFRQILESAFVTISTINAPVIDAINIRQASLKSMKQAICKLAVKADWCLIDGRDIPDDLMCSATAVIKGDGRSFSIAAASIVAKVVRDAIMIEAANYYPQYGFEKHKGYATRAHRLALKQHGPCPLHRRSFAPLRV